MTDDKLDLIGLSLKEISETLTNKDLIQAKEKIQIQTTLALALF